MKRVIHFAGGALLALCLLIFAWYAYPPLGGEGGIFLPPAVSFAQGKGLRNPALPMSYFLDPSGEARHVYHGPLQQLLLGYILKATNVDDLIMVLGVLRAGCVVIATFIFYSIAARSPGGLTWITIGFSFVSLTILSAVLLAIDGRPETLVMFWVLAGVATLMMIWRRPRVFRLLVIGVTIGLTGATSPVSGLGLSIVAILFFGITMEFGKAVLLLCLSAIVALASFFVLMGSLYPFNVLEWIPATLHHGRFGIGGFSPELLVPTYLLNVAVPGLGLIVLLFGVLGIRQLYRHWYHISSPSLVLFGMVLFVAWCWFFLVSVPWKSYNAAPFLPLGFSLLLYRISRAWPVDRLGRGSRLATALRPLAVGTLLVITAGGFVRTTILFGSFLQSGMRREESRLRFRQLRAETSGVIGVSDSLWVLSDEYSSIKLLYAIDDKTHDPVTCWKFPMIVLQQYLSARQTPNAIPGYRLVKSDFVEQRVSLFGITIANSPPGYQFAVYVPEEDR